MHTISQTHTCTQTLCSISRKSLQSAQTNKQAAWPAAEAAQRENSWLARPPAPSLRMMRAVLQGPQPRPCSEPSVQTCSWQREHQGGDLQFEKREHNLSLCPAFPGTGWAWKHRTQLRPSSFFVLGGGVGGDPAVGGTSQATFLTLRVTGAPSQPPTILSPFLFPWQHCITKPLFAHLCAHSSRTTGRKHKLHGVRDSVQFLGLRAVHRGHLAMLLRTLSATSTEFPKPLPCVNSLYSPKTCEITISLGFILQMRKLRHVIPEPWMTCLRLQLTERGSQSLNQLLTSDPLFFLPNPVTPCVPRMVSLPPESNPPSTV